ncbi:MAG: hypothetical protein GXP45_00670 [bacterium]|nr:hypothetical protein [bacterium]
MMGKISSKKNLLKLFIMILFVSSNFLSTFSFAQTDYNQCNSCGTPPPAFHQYESMVREVLASIETQGTQ